MQLDATLLAIELNNLKCHANPGSFLVRPEVRQDMRVLWVSAKIVRLLLDVTNYIDFCLLCIPQGLPSSSSTRSPAHRTQKSEYHGADVDAWAGDEVCTVQDRILDCDIFFSF